MSLLDDLRDTHSLIVRSENTIAEIRRALAIVQAVDELDERAEDVVRIGAKRWINRRADKLLREKKE